ncbi:MAG: DUF2271 domain-containing protein [Spirochaetales bacterium]|nr:DUF2271 domain-containing protein [Spirochaetales bacterium]
MTKKLLPGAALLIINLLAGCTLADGVSATDESASGLTVSLALQNTEDARGHWGFFAWVSDSEGDYVDTLEWYADYDIYTDAGEAGDEWIDAGGSDVDGVSSATFYISEGETGSETLSWDGYDADGVEAESGDYTLTLLVSRHTSDSPYFTEFTADFTVGTDSSEGEFTLVDNSSSWETVDEDSYPYDVLDLTSSSITFNPLD